MNLLADEARAWGIDLTPDQIARFERYAGELLVWNRRVNLTRIVEPADIRLRHFLDSLAVFLTGAGPQAWPAPGARLIDVGSGGGFPGIPMLIVRPDLRLTLLDSVGKKTEFLRHVLGDLGLAAAVVTGRAEEVAHLADHREQYEIAVSRALAPLNVLAELCLPFCAVGGTFIAQKKGDVAGELSAARRAIKLLGGGQLRRAPYALPGVEDGRELVVVQKAHRSQAAYPRRAGLPEHRPL